MTGELRGADEVEDDAERSPSAARMGKAAEYLVAASCILTSRGELNVSTSLVDDEGVDLVFNRRDGSATLAVQVKAHMSDSKQVRSGTFVVFVRSQTFRARRNLDMLFIAVDVERGVIMTAWLVPGQEYASGAGNPTSKGRYRFYASMKPDARDRRLVPSELAPRILGRLAELEAT